MSTTLAAYLHDLSPFVFRVGSGFGLRWYGLSYVAGFVVAWLWMRWMARRGITPLSPDRVTDAMVYLVGGVLVGGRLGYVLFYRPDLLADFSGSFPWWGVLRLNEGGMASHGGIAGVIIASFLIARPGREPGGAPTPRVPVLHVLDLFALACTPGLLFGRLANFINGELLGKVVAGPGEAAPWWSVRYPQEAYTPQAPDGQEAALSVMLEKYRLPTEQTDIETYERIVGALQSGGVRAREIAADLAPLLSARHPSQLYQGATEGLLAGAALWMIWRRPRLPGVVGAWFLILYGVVRVLTEFIRLPDSHLAVQRIAGLSRGQWLSVAMIVVGAVAIAIIRARGAPAMGGWGRAGQAERTGRAGARNSGEVRP
ncbi:MAG: prolipoprotein diacylglyceryl transferase [Planctomycetota bacterium]|nr:prolipoprotein diacylglyceryl transferase [Planctomycetota bacterium]